MLPACGLALLTAPATVLVPEPTLEPTLDPMPETSCATLLVSCETRLDEPGPLQPLPHTVELGPPAVTAEGEDPVGDAGGPLGDPDTGAPVAVRSPRIRAARRPAVGVGAAPPVASLPLRAAAKRRATRDGVAGCEAEAVMATLAGPVAI